MNIRPFILITNDDGIDSPGLHAAAEAVMPLADIIIAAPETQQTAAGRSLWFDKDAVFKQKELDIKGKKITGWSLKASPATTVRHAIQCLCTEKIPDLVISGINFGENVGTNVTVSGTIGAAVQAAIWDVKALAVSLEVPKEFHYYHGKVDWSGAVGILRKAVKDFLESDWPEDTDIIKIDIPDTAGLTTPWKVCRQSREPGWWGYVPDPSPETPVRDTVVRRGPRPGKKCAEDDDITAVLKNREVAVTPLSVNLTSRTDFSLLKKIISDK